MESQPKSSNQNDTKDTNNRSLPPILYSDSNHGPRRDSASLPEVPSQNSKKFPSESQHSQKKPTSRKNRNLESNSQSQTTKVQLNVASPKVLPQKAKQKPISQTNLKLESNNQPLRSILHSDTDNPKALPQKAKQKPISRTNLKLESNNQPLRSILQLDAVNPKVLRQKERQLPTQLQVIQRYPINHNVSRENGNQSQSFGGARPKTFNNCGPEFKNVAKYSNSDSSDRKYPMSYKNLQDLQLKTPNEVIFTIQTRRSGFKLCLNDSELSKEKFAMCLHVLSLASHCDHRESLKNFLGDVLKECETFFTLKLPKYLLESQSSPTDSFRLQSMYYIMDLIEALQKFQPELSLQATQTLIPFARITITRLTDAQKRGQDMLKRLEEMEVKMNSLLDSYNVVHNMNRKDIDQVPNDFRTIPIFPELQDLVNNVRPFLRPNIVEGRYLDVNQYLDVQFRLLREDFIRPLRNGIATYLENQKLQTNKKRVMDIKVYEGVRIIETTLGDDGVAHYVAFDAEATRNVTWETSKRLLYGALVCLTPDNFKSIYFGTVSERVDEQLRKGVVGVKFENQVKILNVQTLIFTMVETEAYFEASRYVLTALQNVDEDTFPMKEYIVELRKTIDKPAYLHDDSVYCFGNLFDATIPDLVTQQTDAMAQTENPDPYLDTEKSEHQRRKEILMAKLARARVKKTDPKLEPHCKTEKKVQLFDENTWPSAEELKLDPSQYLAFKSALTQKLSIIQGPPGTGKTHVGLKIMKAFLHNKDQWNEKCSSPILIVCYTNHALDQFLEGVLKITNKLIRVGGKSRSDTIKPYSMNDLRNNRGLLSSQFRSTRDEVKKIMDKIKSNERLVRTADSCLLTEENLVAVMEEHHYNNFVVEAPHFIKDSTVKSRNVMNEWLGFDNESAKSRTKAQEESVDKNPTDQPWRNVKVTKRSDQDENGQVPDDQNGHDIEYIIEQRMEESDFYHKKREVIFNQSELQEEYNWRTQNSKRTGHESLNEGADNLAKRLKSTRVFTSNELRHISRRNIWSLQYHDRWRLYKTWLNTFMKQKLLEIEDLKKEYEQKLVTLSEMRAEEDAALAKSAYVIGMTTSGAAKYRHLVSSIKAKIVVVEEAAEVLEAQIVTSLSKHTQHLILIGDHQQLRPNPTVYELAKKFNLEISLFERLIKNGIPFVRLGIQHRMRPEISRLLVPHIYQDLEDHESVLKYDQVLGFNKSVFFVSHNQQELQERDTTTRLNLHESQYIVALCKYILLQGYMPSQVTILTTYTGQLFEIKRLLTGKLQDVKATVVDNFQGEENDIILLSFVRSNDQNSIGFLKTENRVCVALSRAKMALFCIGNFNLFAQESVLWTKITNELVKMSAIGPSLDLRCQVHKTSIEAESLFNFNQVPDGGCPLPCDYRMECGHVCPKKCHPLDREHEEVECPKPCERFCVNGHKCNKLCHDDCGDCMVLVSKTVPKCGHESRMSCHVDVEKFRCKHPCPKLLECGHKCSKLCYNECPPCQVTVTKTLPRCGHEVDIICSADVTTFQCLTPCPKILDCGHPCPQRCVDICGGCQVKQKVIGPCKHTITITCCLSKDENELKKHCREECKKFLECGHKCGLLCGDYCRRKCKVRVEVSVPCGHITKCLCYQSKDETFLLENCPETCNTELKCGHKCSGTCAKCFQGRLHVVCEMKCQKLQVCGHPCKSWCSNSCPPCGRPCENRCPHSRCPQLCGYPCSPCLEQCSWKCEHFKCGKLCSEPCDRPPCDHPCNKRLRRCRHPCVGLCGEPCPKLCRICDKEELQAVFFGNEDEPDARFLQLEDCHHVLEIQGLTKWVQEQTGGAIKAISCPKCKTPIRRNLRFGKEVNKSLSLIELVKEKSFGKLKENRELQRQLASKSGDFIYSEYISRNTLEFTRKRLSGKRVLSRNILVTIQNNFAIFEELDKIPDNPRYLVKEDGERKSTKEYVRISREKIISKIANVSHNRQTIQFLNDVSIETRRLQWITKIAKGFNLTDISIERGKEIFSQIITKLTSCKAMTESDFEILNSWTEELKKLIGPRYLDVSQEETLQVVKAMGTVQGHWYSCPNGHVYCITECGRPMEEGTCNECKSTIGGQSHRLRDDNRPLAVGGINRNTAFSGIIMPNHSRRPNYRRY